MLPCVVYWRVIEKDYLHLSRPTCRVGEGKIPCGTAGFISLCTRRFTYTDIIAVASHSPSLSTVFAHVVTVQVYDNPPAPVRHTLLVRPWARVMGGAVCRTKVYTLYVSGMA